MTEGLAAAASGLTAAQARLDALSDDLVNADTPGYRPERVAFHDLLYRHATSGAAAGVTVGAGVAATSMGQSADADVATQQTGPRPRRRDPGPGLPAGSRARTARRR